MKMDMEEMEDPELNVAPLIDMVFLLLVYFMVSASLIQSEADLGIQLPGMLSQSKAVDMPDEQMIEVRANGRVFLNSREFDSFDSQNLPQLVNTLVRYRLACNAARTKALITINADNESSHQRVVDVMNACAAAKIKNVTFAAGAEE